MASLQIDPTALRGVNLDPRSRREQQIAANEARAEEIQDREVRFAEAAKVSLPFADQTNRNIITNWNRFCKFLALRAPHLKGKRITMDHLEQYLPQFLVWVVESSRKVDAQGKIQYLKLSSLIAVRMTIHTYLRIIGKMGYTTRYSNLLLSTLQTQNFLKTKYGLRLGQDEKAVWGSQETALMIKHQWEDEKLLVGLPQLPPSYRKLTNHFSSSSPRRRHPPPRRHAPPPRHPPPRRHAQNKELATQNCLLFTLFSTTGVRPGAILSTRDYPLTYLRYSDVQISVLGGEGQGFGGIVMKMKIQYLKGYQATGQAAAKAKRLSSGIKKKKGKALKDGKKKKGKRASVWTGIEANLPSDDPRVDNGMQTTSHPAIPYTFRSTSNAASVDLDVTFWFLLLAFLRGQLPIEMRTWNDVLAHKGTFEWVNPDDPVFQAQKSRSNLKRGVPMQDQKVADLLRNVSRELNLSEAGKKGGAYAWRRSALTQFAATWGVELAKQLAGHTARSNVLVDVYTVDRLSSLDVFSACIPGEHASRYLPQWRAGMGAEPMPAEGGRGQGTLLDAAQSDMRARTLASLVKATRENLILGTTTWREMEIFAAADGDLRALRDKPTHTVHATLKKLLKRVLNDIVNELEHQNQIAKQRRRTLVDFAEASRAYDERPNDRTYNALIAAAESSKQEVTNMCKDLPDKLEGDDWVIDLSLPRMNDGDGDGDGDGVIAPADGPAQADANADAVREDSNQRIISYGNAITTMIVHKDKLCDLCVADPTVPEVMKQKRWSNRRLAAHKRSNQHQDKRVGLLRWIGNCYMKGAEEEEGYKIFTNDHLVGHLPLWDGQCPFKATNGVNGDHQCSVVFPTRSTNHDGFIKHLSDLHLDQIPEEYRDPAIKHSRPALDGNHERRPLFHQAIIHRLERIAKTQNLEHLVSRDPSKIRPNMKRLLQDVRPVLRRNRSLISALGRVLPRITRGLFGKELRRIAAAKQGRR